MGIINLDPATARPTSTTRTPCLPPKTAATPGPSLRRQAVEAADFFIAEGVAAVEWLEGLGLDEDNAPRIQPRVKRRRSEYDAQRASRHMGRCGDWLPLWPTEAVSFISRPVIKYI